MPNATALVCLLDTFSTLSEQENYHFLTPEFSFATLVFLFFPDHVDRHQEGSREKDDDQEKGRHGQEGGGAQESQDRQKARGGQESQDDEKVPRQEGGAQEKGGRGGASSREAVIVGLRGEAVSVFVRSFVCFYCGAMPYTM